MNNRLSIKEAILYAFDAVVAHPWYFVKLGLVWIGFSFLFLSIPIAILALLAVAYLSLIPIVIGYFILYVFIIFIWFLPAKLLLRFYDNGAEPVSLRLFFEQFEFKLVIKLFLAAALYNFIVDLGILLLIIPGIYCAIKFIFVFLAIIDHNRGIIEAFKRSYNATKDNFWRLFALLIIAGLLMGMIITIPVSLLMMIHAYRQLNPA